MRKLMFLGLVCLLALLASATTAQAQNLVNVTKITSTTVGGGTVILEDSAAKVAIAYKKGSFYAKTVGFTGGSATLVDYHTRTTIWRGPVSGVRIVGGPPTDSLKVLYIRQYLTN